ncbi:MAG: hypothetical protein IIZ83_03310 [Oscillospiraceae bacterium]|nr:hypothetical protein [Oscillospiraceae bacterium]
MWEYAFHVPEQKRLRYIVHTDCKNEADDQFTLAHILMTDKLDVRGIIAGHFDEGNHGGYTEIPAPRIGADMHYLPGDPARKIRVYHTMDVRLDLEDLYAKLQINFG